MLSLLLVCLFAGGIGSILQGAIGIGTGIIIVPLLSLMLPQYGISETHAMHIALATSMAAIAMNSLTALISHQKHGNIQWGLFKKIILFSILGSSLGAFAATLVSGYYLEGIYGIFLLWIAALMFFQNAKHDQIDTMPHFSFGKLLTGGLSIGFVASVVGSGGGILMVPFLHKCKVKMATAVGTATMIGLPVSIMGALTYAILGTSSLSTPYIIGSVHWPALFAFSLIGLIGAPLGVKLARILPTYIVRRLFGVSMMVVGVKMLSHFISST